jgi:OOP family OmpA-OmpF porin
MIRHFRYSVLAVLFSVLSLGSAPASSQDAGGYVGFNFGQSKVTDFDCTGATTCDDKDTAFSIFGGYQFNRNFAVEFAYTDLGQTSASAPGASARFEVSGIEVTGVGIIPINQDFSLYGKLGIFLWDLDVAATLGPLSGTLSEDGTDLTYAIGFRYSFAKNLALQAQWQRYKDIGDSATTGQSDVDAISLGLLFRF